MPLKDEFSNECLLSMQVTSPWYADFVNYIITKIFQEEMLRNNKEKLKHNAKHYVWDELYL